MRKCFLIYEEMRKYFPIYEEAVSHIWLCNCSTQNFPIYEENKIFFFISVPVPEHDYFSDPTATCLCNWPCHYSSPALFCTLLLMQFLFCFSSCSGFLRSCYLTFSFSFTDLVHLPFIIPMFSYSIFVPVPVPFPISFHVPKLLSFSSSFSCSFS
jgi:hypothetical protein